MVNLNDTQWVLTSQQFAHVCKLWRSYLNSTQKGKSGQLFRTTCRVTLLVSVRLRLDSPRHTEPFLADTVCLRVINSFSHPEV